MNTNTEGLAKRARDTKENVVEDSYYNDKLPKVSGTDRRNGMRGIRSLVIAVAAPLVAGFIVSLRNRPDDWYSALNKPSWTPPNWAFALVWSLLYPAMGLASWLVWAKGGWERNMYPLSLYMLQLGLSLLRAPLFFGLHSPMLALLDSSALVVILVMCIFAFKPVNHVASHLMKPYLAWMVLEAALALSILISGWNADTAVVNIE